MSREIRATPVREESIEKSLIASVEGGVLLTGKGHQLPVGLLRRLVDEDTGVETIRPAGVGSGGEFLALEKIVDRLENENVGVQEDALRVLFQEPTVQLGEGDSQLGTS